MKKYVFQTWNIWKIITKREWCETNLYKKMDLENTSTPYCYGYLLIEFMNTYGNRTYPNSKFTIIF